MQLRVVKGYQAGNLLTMDKQTFTIGREPDNDFIIPEAEISRHHCKFFLQDNQWMIQDLESRNGVSINGKQILQTQVLHSGDEITLYKSVFKLLDENEAPAENDDARLSPDDTNKKKSSCVNQNLPNPLELLIPIAKVSALIAILIAICILLYMLLNTPDPTENQTQQATTEQIDDNEEKPTDDDASQAPQGQKRGEKLIKNNETVPMASATQTPAAPLPPPPPPIAPAKPKPPQQVVQIIPPPPPNYLIVKSQPQGAEVILNGQHAGTTPLVLTDLDQEEVSLVLQLKGYENLKRLVKLPDGLPSAPLKMIQRVGTLYVTSNPPGALLQEGRQIHGTTPLMLERLNPGEHHFQLERKGYESQQITVKLSPAKGQQVHVDLQSQLGSLEIITTPAPCKVFVDGRLQGQTQTTPGQMDSQPLIIDNLLPGPCTIKVLHPESGVFDTILATIPKANTAKHRSFLWIPTHKVVLLNGKTIVGMLLRKTNEEIDLLNIQHKRERFIKQEYTQLLPLSPEDQALILKNRAAGKEPSGQFSTKSSLSILTNDFLSQARFASFKGYVKKKICLTGSVTMRMKTPKDTVVEFTKQIRCLLAPTAPAGDYRKIGKLGDAGKPVSLRGVYEGVTKEGIHIFSNCVLLPYPD